MTSKLPWVLLTRVGFGSRCCDVVLRFKLTPDIWNRFVFVSLSRRATVDITWRYCHCVCLETRTFTTTQPATTTCYGVWRHVSRWTTACDVKTAELWVEERWRFLWPTTTTCAKVIASLWIKIFHFVVKPVNIPKLFSPDPARRRSCARIASLRSHSNDSIPDRDSDYSSQWLNAQVCELEQQIM